MSKKTPLYQEHVALGGKIVDFAGWEMPIHYGSQLEEHHQVRQHAGVFDVSHMTVVDVLGPGARDYLRHLLANDVDKTKSRGRALYCCMLNDNGGVIDDLIVYFLEVNHYRVILNAATRDRDLQWMNQHAQGYSVGLHERNELAMVAIQGPEAISLTCSLLASQPGMEAIETLGRFHCFEKGNWFVARTGYTGEDGFEIVLPAEDVVNLWHQLLEVGVKPIGLGARDTLRLEAGLNLYGSDMDEKVHPLNSNLAWTVA